MPLIELCAGDLAITLSPQTGGSLRSFTWRGEPIMRTEIGPGVLDAACFPLVPFSNRIAHGRFEWQGRQVQLSANFPGQDSPHTLHGFGWLAGWEVVASDGTSIELLHRYPGGEWPWTYEARQSATLTDTTLTLGLSLTNLGEQAMPAGLGFHPYFPCNAQTRLTALHQGEWQNDAECLPVRLKESAEARDWWGGAPVTGRKVDTVYTDRRGPMRIDWPDRGLGLAIDGDDLFRHTTIYVPDNQGWFCVEPVSHGTNAVNLAERSNGMDVLAPGQMLASEVRFTVEA